MKLLLAALTICSACSTTAPPTYTQPDGGKWQKVNSMQQEDCVLSSIQTVRELRAPISLLEPIFNQCLKQNKVII